MPSFRFALAFAPFSPYVFRSNMSHILHQQVKQLDQILMWPDSDVVPSHVYKKRSLCHLQENISQETHSLLFKVG